MNYAEQLQEDGWKSFNDPIRQSDAFYKRFAAVECKSNPGQKQVEIYHWNGRFDVVVAGQLPDDSWVNFSNHGLASVDAALKCIPRLLATWNFVATYK